MRQLLPNYEINGGRKKYRKFVQHSHPIGVFAVYVNQFTPFAWCHVIFHNLTLVPMKLRALLLSVCTLAIVFTLTSCGKKDTAGDMMKKDSAMAAPAPAPAPAPKTLYERLGGGGAIKLVVDTFITHVAGDKRINKFFAHANVPHLKQMLVEQISAATGGPVKYTGKDMKTAHHGMKIGDKDFGALVEDLQKALNDYKVPEPEQKELIGALGGMKGDIVGQ